MPVDSMRVLFRAGVIHGSLRDNSVSTIEENLMWLSRACRGVLALVGGFLPAAVFWLLLVAAIDCRDTARTVPIGSPNPAKIPAWQLGWLEVLVYVDPYLAGNMYLWLLPGAAVLAGLALWATGVPVLTKKSPVGWPVPSYAKVIGVSLAVGAFLALPWLYAYMCFLYEQRP
jgi:hypothetical protein